MSLSTMTCHRSVVAAVAASVLVIGLAACSGDGDGGTAGSDGDAATQGTVARVALDGRPVQASFQQTRCKWERDEGHRQVEFEAGDETAGGALDVEIVMSEPPKLDDFALETADAEWKASKSDRTAATISVDGDRYTVSAAVTDENDAAKRATLTVVFTCAGR